MESASNSDRRRTTDAELDAILREVEASRRPPSQAGSRPPPPGRPTLAVVDPKAPESKPERTLVRFEKEIELGHPGELKIRTFQLSRRGILAIVLGAVALLLWVTAPAGLDAFRPSPLPEAYREASARWAMILTAERIDRFLIERRRLPAALDELGPVTSDLITYQRLSETQYRLQAPGERRVIELGPSTTRSMFLGRSIDLLRLGPDRAP